jgi:transposase
VALVSAPHPARPLAGGVAGDGIMAHPAVDEAQLQPAVSTVTSAERGARQRMRTALHVETWERPTF